MPNHCSNDLRIHGTKENIEQFFTKVKGEKDLIDANKIIPYPEEYAKLDKIARDWEETHPYNSPQFQKDYANRPKDGYNQGGYEWCIKNWGTKWGLYDFSEVKSFQKSAVLSFDTAWSPPIPIIFEMSKQFPTLTFTLRFYERGAAYQGVYKVKNGEVLDERDWDYNGERGG